MELKIFKNNYAELWDNKNLIATTKDDNLPNIDFNGIEVEGWVDVEKLAEKEFPLLDDMERKIGYIEGFKTAQSLNDKCFSLEDMKLAWELGSAHGDIVLPDALEAQTEFIQSLQQTEWNVEVKLENNVYIITKIIKDEYR